MQAIATTSIITWALSYLSAKLISKTITSTKSEIILKHGDQICRGGILAYIITQLLPENIEHSGLIQTFVLTGAILATLNYIEHYYTTTCKKTTHTKKPWFNYVLLIPHCILEGFAITPHVISNNMLIIGFFLWHKVSELSLITISTELHLDDKITQSRIQNLFILITPISMLVSTFIHFDTAIPPFIDNIIHILEMSIFMHIALFCNFCSCKHEKNKTININAVFLTAFIVLTLIQYLGNINHIGHHHH